MKRFLILCFAGLLLASSLTRASEPLRVFIRGGKKTHGPGAHDHERFLNDWTRLLNERGIKASGAMNFPTDEQLAQTDVLLMYAQDGGTIPAERRPALDEFVKRGGGLVVIHTATVPTLAKDSPYWKSIIGGSWVAGTTKWLEGPMSLYYLDGDHPITREASNFDMNDEIYYDMDISSDVHVLAAAYTPKTTGGPRRAADSTAAGRRASVFDIQPQMWTYERTVPGGQPYRAFVCIPGHLYTNFARPNFRAVLCRGIAWAAKRKDVNEFCTREELASLRYPEGGPTAPEKAAAKLELHSDFDISLVASEPLINKPINIDWDPQGRLWVAETPEYPNGRRFPNVELWKDSGSLVRSGEITNRPARDRISILIDTDGDGRADKKEIFYEGLELVTSFVFYKDGVIASAAPYIWLIRDTDGDGKAETVTKLYTGLGIGDTHAVINNLRWGFDGWIYATHGYSASDHVRNGDGTKDFGRIGSGVVRFKPDGSAFEQYCSKGGNTWGLDISWDNEVFFTQPTSGDLLNHVVLPESTLARGQVPGARSYKPLIVRRKSFPLLSYDKLPYVQIDLVGSFTASAGCAIYDGGAWPDEWNYSYFTTEPTINIIHHEVVKPEGVSYAANKVREPEFIGGRDMWFRPIETRIGPDGALYLVDFYNQAVVHNDTRGPKHNTANAAIRPDRDHYFGRIWRVQHKQAKKIEIPNLVKASPSELVKGLDHPNIHVRKNAQRLITEKGADLSGPQFLKTFAVADEALQSSPRWNIHWQWILHNLNIEQPPNPPARLRDSPEFMKNSVRLAMADAPPNRITEQPASDNTPGKDIDFLIREVSNPNARVSLDAIVALNAFGADKRVSTALLKVYPGLDDPWRQSAVVGVAAQAPDRFVAEALVSESTEQLTRFISTLSASVAAQANTNQIVSMVVALADGPNSRDALKQVCLESLAKGLNMRFAPEWSTSLQNALRKLIASESPGVRTATLPLVGRWDKAGTLTADVNGLVAQLTTKLNDTTVNDDQRAQVVSSLIALRQSHPEILPTIAKLLEAGTSPALQRRVVETLGQSGDTAAGPIMASAYAASDPSLRSILLGQLLKRADWSLAFLDLIRNHKINATEISPADFYRLRTHSDLRVSSAANELWTTARGDAGLEKNALIAKFTPIVTQPGDAKKGQDLFTINCATCHKLGNLGNEVGPILTGMGAHGPAELLVHILDPNREVDPSFVAYNIETKDGETYDGIITRENTAAVTLKNASGEKEIPVAQIKSRQSGGRSLMPEGFEQLGGEALRDVLTFICASESRFRFIDLGPAFTADSRKGIYTAQEALYDTLKFRKFGPVTVAGIPFNVVDPARSPGGKNLVVLKGGASRSFSRTLPQRVEAKVGFAVAKFHFLGGVGGWAYPGGGDGAPVMKVTAHFADGQKEELVMKNGDEFADYIRVVDVPGSTLVENVVTENQLRWYSKPLRHSGTVERLELESFNNGVAPTTVAITAELPDASSPPPPPGQRAEIKADAVADVSASTATAFQWGEGTRVLLVGGGTSHDFNRWFNRADSDFLKQSGCSVNYTEDPAITARELPHAQVAIFSVNKRGFPTEVLRKAFTEFADAGKGLVLLHPGVWYNWPEWADYNRAFAGGGSRGHDAPLEFEVKITDPSHPLTKGLPATFEITDELYWFQANPKGTPIEVLATAHSPAKKADFPMIWVVKHPETHIACIALGHDGRAHNLPEFQQLLKNAVNWCASR